MRKLSMFALLAFIALALFTIAPQPTHAANCDGLPVTTGALPSGIYTLTDDCVTTGILNVPNGADVTINGNGFTIDGNITLDDVIQIYIGGTLTLDNVIIRNGADDGVQNQGVLTVRNSTFSGNGYGIYNTAWGTLTVLNSLFSGNTNLGILNSGPVTVSNSTFSGNGGGIFNNPATITITNSTFSGNTTGIFNNGTVTITNTILSANTAANCDGGNALTDGGGNLIHTANGGACAGITPHVDADPILGAFNGRYYPLLDGSPAIDGAPTCAGLTNDQIGTARPQGIACDIGAIEVQQIVVIDPDTGEETFEVVQPSSPSLNQWNGDYPDETRGEAYGVDDSVYATIHMQNGAWQYSAGAIPQDLIDYGVVMAIDVWEQGGDQYFETYERVCLLGEGRLIYFDATQSPRPMVEIPTDYEDGYTCGWIPNAGMLVLINDSE